VFAKSKEFAEQIKDKVSRIVMEDDIPKLSKKEAQEIADSFNVLLAEGPVMLTVGKHLGQLLAPKGKMPKPITANPLMVEEAIKKMGSTTKISNRKGKSMPVVHLSVGNEKMPDEQLTENILAAFNAVESTLPNKAQNIKSVYVKLTMGPAIKIGGTEK
jgi:large subunit ribosomal protein L1